MQLNTNGDLLSIHIQSNRIFWFLITKSHIFFNTVQSHLNSCIRLFFCHSFPYETNKSENSALPSPAPAFFHPIPWVIVVFLPILSYCISVSNIYSTLEYNCLLVFLYCFLSTTADASQCPPSTACATLPVQSSCASPPSSTTRTFS